MLPEDQKVQQFIKYLNNKLKEDYGGRLAFAKKMGVSKLTVVRWLTGESIMDLKKYYKALKILELEESLFTIEKKSKKVKINAN